MSNIIRFGTDTQTFSIKVYYDSSAMEVQAIEFPYSFEKLNGLSQADLLQDVISELDRQRGNSFDNYADDTKQAKLKAVE